MSCPNPRAGKQDYGVDRVVIYGTGAAARQMASTLLDSPRLGLRPVAVIDDDSTRTGECLFEMAYRRSLSVTAQSGPVTAALLRSHQCKLLIVALPNLAPEKLTAAAQAAKQAGLEIALLSDSQLKVRESRDIGGLLLSSTPANSRPAISGGAGVPG